MTLILRCTGARTTGTGNGARAKYTVTFKNEEVYSRANRRAKIKATRFPALEDPKREINANPLVDRKTSHAL